MESDYWSRFARTRTISRRRALGWAGSGLAALGAGGLLAGCGGRSSGGSGGDASGLLSKPQETTEKAVRGGSMTIAFTTEPTDFNPLVSAATTSNQTIWVYSRLLKHKAGKYPNGPDGSAEADAAESWEVSPDLTQVTFKLRANMPFDQRPPTSGRMLTSADVKYSWETFAAKNAARSDVSNAVSSNAPIAGLQAPDARTVVFKLAFPYATPLDLFSHPNYLQVVPTEADSGFDPRSDSRGSGAWFMQEYRRNAYVSYRRNTQWYVKDRPFLDGVDAAILPEYAAGLAQFVAGRLATFSVRAEDIVPTKKSVPQLLMVQDWFVPRSSPGNISFGWNAGSPFLDERVRQAVSMLVDRDSLIRTITNVEDFESKGLKVPVYQNTTIPAGDTKYWLDPHGKGLGDAARSFSYDPAEAKKLLRAAGFSGPLKTKFTYTTNGYVEPYLKQAEILRGMLTDHGDFELQVNALDYQSAFRYGWSDVSGADVQGLEGIYLPGGRPSPNIDLFLNTNWHSQGSKVKYWPPDATVDDTIRKQRAESDEAKRISIIQELQRYLTKKMYNVPFNGLALGFTLYWPWLGNAGMYASYATGTPQEASVFLWYDASKKTA